MNFIKAFFKGKLTRAWFIVTCIFIALVIVVDVLAFSVFESLIITVLGRDRPILGEGVEALYVAETASKEDALENAEAVNLEINKEGIVLLKNDENALPLAKGANVSVFGKNSVNIVYGGTGSGAVDASKATTLYESLEKAGFNYNKDLKEFYESSKSGSGRPDGGSIDSEKQTIVTGETPLENYTGDLAITAENYKAYNDAALVVISRVGGEGNDVPMTTVNGKGERADGAREGKDDHALQLDQNEADMLKAVCEADFETVILIVNSSNALELGFLKDGSTYSTDKGYGYDYAAAIDGAVWIGGPGANGILALGTVLNGETNPSGRLVDTYAMDFKKDPTWQNFGYNGAFETSDGHAGNRYVVGGKGGDAYEYGVEYEEGIYVGYRYDETRGFTDGEEWYEDNVVFPFGYGLSYTTFEWTIDNKSSLGSALSKDSFAVEVTVKNTGAVAGKDVVELYVTSPYKGKGGIERPHVQLVGFAKTKLIEPGKTDTVKITVDPYDFAAYDYLGVSGDAGYKLESGDYVFHVSKNAHDWSNDAMSFTKSLTQQILYENDPDTGYKVVNLYDDADDTLEQVLSRSDWEGTWPDRPTAAENAADGDALHAALSDRTHNNPNADSYTQMPTQATTPPRTKDGKAEVTLRDLVGADLEGEKWDDLWKQLLDAIMFKDLVALSANGNFRTIAIEYIYKNETIETDGPAGFTNFMMPGLIEDVCAYATECVVGSTWNTELIREMGEAVGEESLQGNGVIPYSGWYAPAVNLHRSPFGGRNYEYFSEDSFLSGTMAAAEVAGARSKGVTVYVKHFAVNEQETNRQGVATWLTEQALREIYLKPFEFTVKDGGATGMMSSFNRIGARWTGGDYRLLTEILRNEWGFCGTVITDFNTIPDYMNVRQMAYAGGDLDLATTPHEWANKDSAADVTVLRNAVKNILYTTVNSNAMNADIQGYAPAYWKIVTVVVESVLGAGLVVWGVLSVIRLVRKGRHAEIAANAADTSAE